MAVENDMTYALGWGLARSDAMLRGMLDRIAPDVPFEEIPLREFLSLRREHVRIPVRIGVIEDWRSRWYARKKEFGMLVVQDKHVRDFVKEYKLADGRRLYVLADGRLINLASAEGHPASVMDMSFANQALAAEYMVKNAYALEAGVYPVPADIDAGIAKLKLATMGVKIDVLTPEQEKYLASWQGGTV